MSWLRKKAPSLADRIKMELARARDNAHHERNQADYFQALADLNEHQATADRHRAMAEFNDKLVDRYMAELDQLDSLSRLKKEAACVVPVSTSTAPSVSSIALGLRRLAGASSQSKET